MARRFTDQYEALVRELTEGYQGILWGVSTLERGGSRKPRETNRPPLVRPRHWPRRRARRSAQRRIRPLVRHHGRGRAAGLSVLQVESTEALADERPQGLSSLFTYGRYQAIVSRSFTLGRPCPPPLTASTW